MIIGVPRERKAGERRVAITPDGAADLVALGHQVLIEQSAGELSGFPDQEYKECGATLAPTLDDVWTKSNLLVKVKEPAPEETKFFRQDLTVFSFLHLAVDKDLTEKMVHSGVTGLDYDLLQLDDGRLPILEPMSVIAGKLSIQCGAYALQASMGGKGILLGGSVGVKPARVLVIGAGAAGSNAARVAMGMGAEVTVMDINPVKLEPFAYGHLRARTIYSSPRALEREVADADLVIGAVLIPGALAPKLVTRRMIQKMRPGSVLVDICIDQGGVSETSRPTSIPEPTYVDSGVLHYCVTNMPALVPRTSTEALTSASLPWIKLLATYGIDGALKKSVAVKRSLTSFKKNLTNEAIARSLSMPFVAGRELDALLG